MRIYLIGFMGSGKTYWGKAVSQKLNLPFFDLDEQIVASEGKSINDIFAEEGEEYFRLKEKEVLYIISESHESFIMAAGGGTPCYYNNIDYMKKMGTAVWINISVDLLFNRLIKEKAHRPLLRDFTDDQLRSYIIKKYSDRKIFYQQASIIINEEDLVMEKVLNTIFHN
jgi:shikimate kinase